MERRNFLILATGGIAALAIPSLYYMFGPPAKERALADAELLSYIMDAPIIAGIGKKYQEQFPDHNTEQKLIELLSESIADDSNDLSEELNRKISEDYKNGKIIMLDGWLLSETEARQCALFSLTHSN